MHLALDEFYLKKALLFLGVLLGALICSFLFKKVIDLIFIGMKTRVSNAYILAKTRTIRSLMKNLIDAILFLIASLIILSHLGVNIIPILTGAGILGLAFSFGAQTFVKDLISGFFIIAEDQFNVGDTIKIEKYEGEVVRMTLRMTVMRDKKGNTIYIPNSQITTVTKLVDTFKS